MRLRAAISLSVVSACLGASLVACFDLFHSTADVLTACELDAETPGCADDGGTLVEAGTDFCAWDDGTAHTHATQACAWLGACESTLGNNAFGPCMFQALLAYDCSDNPHHPSRGAAHERWDCLWQAQSCADVDRCILPGGAPSCAAGVGTVCASSDGSGANGAVRLQCAPDGGRIAAENCALWEQTCGGEPGSAACGGAAGPPTCTTKKAGCTNASLSWCGTGGADIGVDCDDNGAGRCVQFTGSNGKGGSDDWVACVPLSDAGSCDASEAVSCDRNGIATSCPAQQVERLNCADLLGSINGCTPGVLAPAFDWTSACVVHAATSDGGIAEGGPPGTCVESCVNGVVTSCTRGASFTVDCDKDVPHLSGCQIADVGAPDARFAACTPQ